VYVPQLDNNRSALTEIKQTFFIIVTILNVHDAKVSISQKTAKGIPPKRDRGNPKT
jgi:hypothetical protein